MTPRSGLYFDWSWAHFGFGVVVLTRRNELHVLIGWLNVTFAWGV